MDHVLFMSDQVTWSHIPLNQSGLITCCSVRFVVHAIHANRKGLVFLFEEPQKTLSHNHLISFTCFTWVSFPCPRWAPASLGVNDPLFCVLCSNSPHTSASWAWPSREVLPRNSSGPVNPAVVYVSTLDAGGCVESGPKLCLRLVLFCAECFCEGGEDTRIPLLREVFEAFPGTPVNIDIKVDNDTLIKKVRLDTSAQHVELNTKPSAVIRWCHNGNNYNICRFLSWLLSMIESIWLSGAILATRLWRSVTKRYVYLKFSAWLVFRVLQYSKAAHPVVGWCLRLPPPLSVSPWRWGVTGAGAESA